MISRINSLNKSIRTSKGKHITVFALLLSCSIFIFVLPIFSSANAWFSFALIAIIIFLAASSISGKLILIGLGAIVVEWATEATDLISLNYLAELTTNLFIIYVVGSALISIMKRENVTIYTLVEALNGYLLLGILFISLVSFIDINTPGSFSGTRTSGMELTYYTMITLTTTGYGDITPQLPIAKSLSMVISVAGQFYVAVVVAILVGKYAGNLKN